MTGRRRLSDAEIEDAVAASLTLTEAVRRLGLRAAGGNFAALRRHIARLGLSTDHFDPNAARRAANTARGQPLEQVLVENCGYSRSMLKRRLYAAGLKQRRCELCGQGELWRGRRMALILDHINGVADDNRLENLQIVCPNCAATPATHCGRNLRQVPVERLCLRCGETFVTKRPEQRYCSTSCGTRWDRARLRGPRPSARRVERPPYAQLKVEIAATNWAAVGRRYGVTGNAVRKWVRAYERTEEDRTMLA